MRSRGAGDKVADRYVLEVELGRGGMGSVWKAYDHTLKRHVAIKSIVPGLELDAAARSRFEREAQAVARLKSSHIVQVFDYGVDGAPYIVMEMLEGLHLGQLLDGHRRLPLDVAARVVAQVARGLGAAHDARIVHRDLKPANVFIARMGGEDVVKVLDFGVARAFADHRETGRVTAQGHVLGTPRFMSPESLRGAPADPQADVWSLAVMAYRAVTGRYPFEGEDLGEVAKAILDARPAMPSTVVSDLPRGVDDLFRRALHPRPDQRFSSARELADALCAVAGVAGSLGGADGITASVDASGPHSGPLAMEPTRTATTIDAGVLTGSIGQIEPEPRYGLWSSRFALVAIASTILGVGLAFAWSASRARTTPPASPGDAMPLVAAPASSFGDGAPAPVPGPSEAAPPEAAPSAKGSASVAASPLPSAHAPSTPPGATKPPPSPPVKPPPPPKKNGDDLFNGIF